MSYIIREMFIEDVAKVQDVAKKSWNATYEGIIPHEIQENFLKAAYSDAMMEHRFKSSLLLVAEMDQNIVGFANYSSVKNKREAELGAIYIYPEYQGIGIGTGLLQEGIKTLDNVEEIYIDVERENEIGKTFYEAKGFSVVEEFDDNFDGYILKTIRMVLKV